LSKEELKGLLLQISYLIDLISINIFDYYSHNFHQINSHLGLDEFLFLGLVHLDFVL
jgi:hypothetical protein